MSKAFRATYRSEIVGGDDPLRFGDRLRRMSGDAALTAKVKSLISAAQATARANDRATAIGTGAQAHHLGMRLRNVHDALGQHVHDACHGALYRSTSAERLMRSGEAGRDRLHCEHAIPIKLAAGMIYELRAASEAEFAAFILTSTPVVAITREERLSLDRRRTCGTKTTSAWRHSHPSFLDGNPDDPREVLPFARYLETGIELVRWTDETPIQPALYTLQDHFRAVGGIELYRASTYGFED